MAKNVHREMIQRMFHRGRWFNVCRDMFATFSLEEAVMLSYLCGIGDLKKGEWFPCSTKKVEHNLRISFQTQRRILASLERRKVIKRKQTGIPARRFFWIDYELVLSLVDAAIEQEIDVDTEHADTEDSTC